MIIRSEIEPPRSEVELVGRFDAHEVAAFRLAVDGMPAPETTVLRVDLSRVDFVDSTALAELVRLRRTVAEGGGELVLARPSDATRVILEITGLAELFTIEHAAAGPV